MNADKIDSMSPRLSERSGHIGRMIACFASGFAMGVLAMCTLLAVGVAQAAETREPDQHFFNPNTGDFKAELADAKSAGKKAIFFMFEQEGCSGCIYMKRNVLNRTRVQAFYRERFLNFSVDIHGAVPLKDFTGRDATEKSFAQKLGVSGTPTFLFYDLQGAEIIRIVGPVRDVGEFMLLGEFVSSGAYKTRTFSDYKDSRRTRKGT